MLTVLITTHNRVKKLDKCLSALWASHDRDRISDVVVVDDGSTDDTRNFLEQKLAEGAVTIALRNDTAKGPATARNQGIRRAKSEFTLIMGDDVIFVPSAIGWFCKHIEQHGLDNASIIGNIMPIPEDMTAFEYWSCNGGSQFGHNRIQPSRAFDAGDEHFYTSNVVTPTALLRRFRFEESFPYARYEDRELAYRLKRKTNHKVRYEAEAKSYHDHRYTFRGWLQNFEKFTWSALHFSNLYPEDLRLRRKLGIDQALAAKTFSFSCLADAVQLLNKYHNQFFASDSGFGQKWLREWMASSFRMVQEFFRTNHYRTHLDVSPLKDQSTGMNGDVAMTRLLECLDPKV